MVLNCGQHLQLRLQYIADASSGMFVQNILPKIKILKPYIPISFRYNEKIFL